MQSLSAKLSSWFERSLASVTIPVLLTATVLLSGTKAYPQQPRTPAYSQQQQAATQASAQLHQLSGHVTDEFNHPLAGATVTIRSLGQGNITDRKGDFAFDGLRADRYLVSYSFVGYQSATDTIWLNKTTRLTKKLCPATTHLGEITITGIAFPRNPSASLSVGTVDKRYLQQQAAGSLMQSLNRLPGIGSMDIGSGQSKPVIRGLGFHRVVVAENGVKHEAQEWGADHGLEIDRFTVERVEIIKGPASLMYGANAIGGVIDLKQLAAPAKNTFGGSVIVNGATNNQLVGASARIFRRFDHFYIQSHFSKSTYADYRVPTDSISYMTYNIRLKDRRLRNTAGNETTAGIRIGYLGHQVNSHLSVTNNFSKSGFFANAHGLEIRNSQIDYDRSARDIDLPSQQVNHFKLLSNTTWMITDYKLNFDFGYQHNYRQEFSEPVAHGNMPLPPDSLERLYNKSTWTAHLKLELPKHNRHQFTTGISTEIQNNSTGGWGFMLPAYQSSSAGAYVYDFVQLSEQWSLNGGVRFDAGKLTTREYRDWYATRQPDGTEEYIQRATPVQRRYNSFSWGAGASYKKGPFSIKSNAGKSFRMPSAKELASNGINYHMYRYEKGDTTLGAEESYQIDLGIGYSKGKWGVELTPFANYFPNYIYLNPTPEYYEAQQIYYHSQSEVFRTGGELVINYDISQSLQLSADAEYTYSVQLSGAKKGYTLPFSPPLNAHLELLYTFASNGIFEQPEAGISMQLAGAQSNTVPPEKKTAGYTLFNLRFGTRLKIAGTAIQVNAKLANLLNTRYYDHTSFYRLIEVPGPGRNFLLTTQFEL